MTRRNGPIRAGILACLLLIAMSLISTGGQNPTEALVVSSEGYADVQVRGTDKFVPLVEGTGLTVGDTIQTDSEAKVVLRLPDKSTLIIGENSRVVIRELGMVEVTKISSSTFEIIKGKIRAIVNPFINPESTFMIKTNNATVGVRGTDFGELYDPDTDRTYVLGLENCVSLTPTGIPGSTPILLCAGDELTILGGQRPGAPIKASDKTIDMFLEEMAITLPAGEIGSPYINTVFVNRIINLQDIDGTLTLTQDDLTIDNDVVINGTAADESYAVTEVEVSLDRGTTWKTASGTTNWSYKFVPQEMLEYELMIRAKNEKGAISDPGELGSWIIVYQDEDYESIARSMIDKFFAAVMTGDSSADDLVSDYYDGVIDNVYSKSELIDKIRDTNRSTTASYTINQVNSTGETIVASISWSATVNGNKSDGTSKFWLSKADDFRITHSEGTWFLKSSRMPEIKLEIVSSIYGPPCENALRILLVVPDVPANVSSVIVYPITTCESTHFAILTRAGFEDMTGETDGFGGDFHYEKTTGCTASGGPPCAGTIPFLYQDLNPLVTVNYTDYGYNLSASTMLPSP